VTFTQEWLLALVLVALYLHDSLSLTTPDSAFLVRAPGGWTAHFPTVRFTVRGKHVFIPPLLPPATPLFALGWARAGIARSTINLEEIVTALMPLTIASAFCFYAVMLVAPIVLLTTQSTPLILFAFAQAYLAVLATIALLWISRSKLHLARSQCITLTAEMLLCPPVAANLARRISQQTRVEEGFISAARALLTPSAWEHAREELGTRIDVQMEEAEPGSVEHRQLQELRGQLA
jgi:hypothetical protein